MQTTSLQPAASVHTSFLGWYFRDRPREMIDMYGSYVRAFGEMFAIVFLLKTLFAPWKSIHGEYPDQGFHPSAILETWSMNATTRSIGAVVRLATIIAGIAIQAALFILFAAYLIAWMLFPLLMICGIPFFLYLII